jgi:hypothetical protein
MAFDIFTLLLNFSISDHEYFLSRVRSKRSYQLIIEWIFNIFGYCDLVQCNNGGEFVDQIQTTRLESYSMKIIHSAQYKLSLNGTNKC